MNNVALTGRFTRDPDIRYTDGGSTIARFTLACDRRFKQENGQAADFISCVAFGKTAEFIEKYFQKDLTKNLSQSALEILAIVAYRQPITRVEIDDIRGVNSSGALQTLVWRGLIETNGKKEAPGHPKLYVTTDYFLQYFNYQSLADLPLIEDFEDSANNEEIDLFDPKKTDQDTQKEGQ